MIIREATLEDAAPIVCMAIRFLEETPYGHLFAPNEQKLTELLLQVLTHGVIFVAERADHTLAGFLALVTLEHPISGERYADELAWWVNPESRSGSIGPRLLAAAEEFARTAGIGMLKMVAPAGTDVGRFYERLGYAAVETSYHKRL